tara:strand:- start:1659 stop:1844 length:186 start_codon:yes stop_codon:yes gene_type:complete
MGTRKTPKNKSTTTSQTPSFSLLYKKNNPTHSKAIIANERNKKMPVGFKKVKYGKYGTSNS